jgi:DNA-directed RNA polymerase specialized sigma24 family protein
LAAGFIEVGGKNETRAEVCPRRAAQHQLRQIDDGNRHPSVVERARNARRRGEDTDLRAWLFTVARKEYRSYCRAQLLDMGRLLVLGRGLPSDGLPDGGGDAELAAVEAALATLGDPDRELLLLVCVEGIDARAAAEMLGISYAALRQRLARARKRLSDALEARELPSLAERSRTS